MFWFKEMGAPTDGRTTLNAMTSEESYSVNGLFIAVHIEIEKCDYTVVQTIAFDIAIWQKWESFKCNEKVYKLFAPSLPIFWEPEYS